MRAYLLRYGTKIYWRVRLAKNRVPVEVPLLVRKHVRYHGWRKAHKLDVYRPENPGVLPAIVFVHGGGWVMGDKHERRDICQELAAQGFVVFAINYRLSPESRFPAPAIDGLRAMEWVAAHAHEFGGDAGNITLVGDSSGAHIAAIMASARDSKPLQGAWGVDFAVTARAKKMVLYYGFYNLHQTELIRRKYFKTYIRAYLGTTQFDNYKLLDYFSPIEHLTAHYPTTLLIASEADPLCQQSTDMYAAIHRAGANANLCVLNKKDYPQAWHGFLTDAGLPAARRAFAEVVAFLG